MPSTGKSRKLTEAEHAILMGGALIAILVFGIILTWTLELTGVLEFCREVCHAPESAPS